MKKPQVRGKVRDRFPSVYPKAVVAVMLKVIDLIKVDNWKFDDIEDRFSEPKSKSKLSFLTGYSTQSIALALTNLLKDGYITQSTEHPDSYSVNTSKLFDLPSRFVSKKEAAETAKRNDRNRKRISRLEKMLAKLKAENTSDSGMRGLW